MQYKLYIPTNCLNKIIYVAGVEYRLDVYMSSSLNMYGGYTMYTARGSFVDKNKMTITENVTIYELITDDNKALKQLEHLLSYIKKQLNEESMLMWCGGGEGVWV